MMLKAVVALDQKRLGRVIVGIVGILVAVGYLIIAQDLSVGTDTIPGPGLFPRVVGIAAVAISLLVVIESIVSAQVSGDIEWPKGTNLRLVLIFVGLTLTFIVLLPILGQYIASSLYLIAMLKALSPLAWWRVIVYGTIVACAASFLFIQVFEIPLPEGFWS